MEAIIRDLFEGVTTFILIHCYGSEFRQKLYKPPMKNEKPWWRFAQDYIVFTAASNPYLDNAQPRALQG